MSEQKINQSLDDLIKKRNTGKSFTVKKNNFRNNNSNNNSNNSKRGDNRRFNKKFSRKPGNGNDRNNRNNRLDRNERRGGGNNRFSRTFGDRRKEGRPNERKGLGRQNQNERRNKRKNFEERRDNRDNRNNRGNSDNRPALQVRRLLTFFNLPIFETFPGNTQSYYHWPNPKAKNLSWSKFLFIYPKAKENTEFYFFLF
jgi:hypothetical protein